MRGYEVVSSDQRTVGRVAEVKHGYLIVESGRPRRTRRPVPREFVHVVDEASKVFVTVPRRVLSESPRVDDGGHFDLDETARHYGLAASLSADHDGGPAEHRRAEIRKHVRPGLPAASRAASRALLGDRRVVEPRVRE